MEIQSMTRHRSLACGLALAALVLLMPERALAHALAPVVVRVTHSSAGSVGLSVRFPSPEQAKAGISVAGCDVADANAALRTSLVWAGHLTCRAPLQVARQLVLPGGAPTGLLLEDARGPTLRVRLHAEVARGGAVALPEQLASGAGPLAGYLGHGVRHVWSGADHLAFMACLVLMCGAIRLGPAMRRLVSVVSVFTVAHSLSLAISVSMLRPLNSAGLEAAIALSVVFAAREALRLRSSGHGALPQGTTARLQLSALAFGVLHGLGFAGGLFELGLPSQHVPVALLLFNLGVELGQLAFVCCLAALLSLVPRRGAVWARFGLAYAAGSCGVYWLVERVGLLPA